MKILHLSSEKTWRGGEQQIAYLIQEQMLAGESVMVACKRDSVFEKYCMDNRIPYQALSFSNSFDMATATGIKKLHKAHHFDIIHLHSSRSHSLAILATKFGLKANLILSRRVDFPSSGNALSNYKYNHPQIKKIICVSEKVKEIIGQTIRDKNKLCVVYDGIDLKRFEGSEKRNILHEEFGLSPETKIVANISALAGHKDYITFVNTVAAFKKKHDLPVKFFIIGEGDQRTSIEEHINATKTSGVIIMTGFRDDVPDIFPEIDVFLMTSKEEGLGSTNLDAFANRIPVVATAGGGIPEVVKHEKTGLLAPVQASEILAEHLFRMLTDNELQTKVTQNAYKVLNESFTKEVMAKKTMEWYKSVISET
ncbi:glycosyltransferase family 4 protein [Parvicella tangerina]|uniref:N-acetyl-alpha-D-glucosaminyl L-malate synthase n=1 Tax=Parvicella tangerina TaxID=2829795 RepID=A0A916JP37_9FLAO|nr:glycosyltransferase family 4 protein [Parvicella tangerina]CAG5083397.1 N-acetyl-alpha-D-glucosaminyl L-malate synthase [Parvicella tangerina]